MNIFLSLIFTLLLFGCGKTVEKHNIPKQTQTIIPSSERCFEQLKKDSISGDIKLLNEKTKIDDTYYDKYLELMSEAPIKHQFYIHKIGSGTMLEKKSLYKNEAEISFEFGSSEKAYYLSINLDFQEGNHRYILKKSHKIQADCQLQFQEIEIKEFSFNKNKNNVLFKYHNKINESKTDSIDFNGKFLGLYNFPEEKYITSTQFKDSGYCLDKLNIVPCKYSLLKTDIDTISYIYEMDGAKFKGNITLKDNQFNALEYYDPVNYSLNTISANQFLNTRYKSTEQSIKLTSFTNDYFYSKSSNLKVVTDYHRNEIFLKNYFNLKKEDDGSIILSIKADSLITSSLSSELYPEEDKVFITGSRFIEISHPKILELKEKIKLQKPKTREDILYLVQKEVTQLLEYDHEMVENDLVKELKLDDFINKGKGVCQHYALLSTTLLRSLGVPARIMVGIALGENGNYNGHAWIEVKLSNKNWTPIEPQAASNFKIMSLDYYPLSIMGSYEKGNPLFKEQFEFYNAYTHQFEFLDGSK